jgi:SdrD B-like domain
MRAPALPKFLLCATAVLIVFGITASVPAFADPPLPGAVFTTNFGCTGVDLNIYASKTDVYLQGGPDKGGENPPAGSYYVQVTDPSGATVLGTSVGGVAAGVLSTDTPFVVAANGTVNCFELFNAVMNNGAVGYADTSNPGGEYKVWVSTDGNFANNTTKTDNFKVLNNGTGSPPPPSITGIKFYDTNVNGVQDSGEPGINGWWIDLFTQDPSTLSYSFTSDDNTHNVTGTDGIYSFDNLDATKVYGVCEVIPSGSPTWVATTAKSAKGLIPPTGFNFGNVCLGTGGQNAVTLGFWSNKNGQLVLTGSKTGTAFLSTFTFINSLNLKNASGGSAVPFANYAALQTFLLKATATNMAYMLSAQLATMELNVASTNVSGGAIVYAPGTGLSYNGITDFTTVTNLMAAANTELGAHNYTPSGSAYRSYQEALKNALDGGNNGNNFVEPSLTKCTVPQYTGSCAP